MISSLWLAIIVVLMSIVVYLASKRKSSPSKDKKSSDDECMMEGKDEEFIADNDRIQKRKETTRMFLFPSLFTDHRIFSNQKKIYGDILQVIDLFELDENIYGKVDEL